MPTGIGALGARGRRKWVASIFAAVDFNVKAISVLGFLSLAVAQVMARVVAISIGYVM